MCSDQVFARIAVSSPEIQSLSSGQALQMKKSLGEGARFFHKLISKIVRNEKIIGLHIPIQNLKKFARFSFCPAIMQKVRHIFDQ